jgi:hypothetical protein
MLLPLFRAHNRALAASYSTCKYFASRLYMFRDGAAELGLIAPDSVEHIACVETITQLRLQSRSNKLHLLEPIA